MRVNTASLFGWISPTGQGAGFKLPVFQNEKESNTLLVQSVDSLGTVVGFSEFETEQEIERSDIKYLVKKGDNAFWCFGLENKVRLTGTKDEILSKIKKDNIKIDRMPYVGMQIVNSFGIDALKTRAQKAVYGQILNDVDLAAGWNWLDAEVFTPALRDLLFPMLKISRRQRLIFSFMTEVVCVTERELKIVLPSWVMRHIKKRRDWQQFLVHKMQELTANFDIATSRDIMFNQRSFDPVKSFMTVNVDALKDQVVKSFSLSNNVDMSRVSKSYFQNASGSVRVVCTFSSRYENRGKRKYWYGYHAIWDEWLKESAESFLIIGCIDTRTAFALPAKLIRKILIHLRSTGEGKDKYWHLDIIDLPNGQNLLDRTKGMLPLSLKEYELAF